MKEEIGNMCGGQCKRGKVRERRKKGEEHERKENTKKERNTNTRKRRKSNDRRKREMGI